MRVALVMAAALLAGCAEVRFDNPSVSREAATRDHRECHFEAERAAAAVWHPNSMIAGADQGNARRRVMAACMAARGYTQRLERTF